MIHTDMIRRSFIPLVALILLGLTPMPVTAQDAGQTAKTQEQTTTAQMIPASFADLADRLSPSVVNISTTQKIDIERPRLPGNPFQNMPEGSPFEQFFEEFFNRQFPNRPMPDRGPGQAPDDNDGDSRRSIERPYSLGSGFIIDSEEGYIVTNNHVVEQADEIKVILNDDTTLDATMIGTDEKTDLAVLQVPTDDVELQAAKFGDSDQMRVGDWIVAIGNPFGLGGTVTAGIISAAERNINAGPYDDFLQTDASINRGNSGGPMFNLNGQVIGVNTAIFSPSGGSVGIGFAVPSAMAKPVIQQLINYGETRRGWLGVRIQTVTDDIADSLGLDSARGALVASVTPNGPAEDAGIKAGDVILSFNNKPVPEMRELPRMVAETEIGADVPVTVWRQGDRQTLEVDIGRLEEAEEKGLLSQRGQQPGPSDDKDGEETTPGTKLSALGLTVLPVNDTLIDEYGLEDDVTGLVITKVEAGSNAAQRGLRPGDVIFEANQEDISSVRDLREMIDQAERANRGSILLRINRDGNLRFVVLRLADGE
jgi:serine protease Do